MSNKANLNYSPLTNRIYWGRTNNKGIAVGEKRDVTSEFIQVMLMKFEPNTAQYIAVNGVNKYQVVVVDADKTVTVNGKEV